MERAPTLAEDAAHRRGREHRRDLVLHRGDEDDEGRAEADDRPANPDDEPLDPLGGTPPEAGVPPEKGDGVSTAGSGAAQLGKAPPVEGDDGGKTKVRGNGEDARPIFRMNLGHSKNSSVP